MNLIIVSIAVIIIDQLSKLYIQETMWLGLSLPVWENVFHITYILNPGAAFGILENQRLFFIVVAAALVIAAVRYYPQLKGQSKLFNYGVALLVGGAVGNLTDRIVIGQVVDFLDFRIWPIFNIADIAIVVGVGMIIYDMVFLNGAEVHDNV